MTHLDERECLMIEYIILLQPRSEIGSIIFSIFLNAVEPVFYQSAQHNWAHLQAYFPGQRIHAQAMGRVFVKVVDQLVSLKHAQITR